MKPSAYRILRQRVLGVVTAWMTLLPEAQAQSSSEAAVKGWPSEVREVRFTSSFDHSQQPALIYLPSTSERVPLLVALHTWSKGYIFPEVSYARWCIKNGWALVRPDFRGANKKPEACGSEGAVQDIVDAVEYARKHANIDPDRIYLAGVSGGGHASLLLAGRHPEIWAAVTAWCPIEDLSAWHARHSRNGVPDNYGRDLEAICGGAPGSSPQVDEQYRKRSPAAWLTNGRGVILDINAGIRDGHKGSVPVGQSLNAFNLLADEKDRIPEDVIARLTAKPEVPSEWRCPEADPLYERGEVLFRKISGNARVSLFQGAHEMFPEAALAWLSKQRKGSAPVWKINEKPDQEFLKNSSEASK